MIRYYFDIRDNSGLSVDEEGLEFPTQQEAEIEAARSLADLAKEFADIRPSADRRRARVSDRIYFRQERDEKLARGFIDRVLLLIQGPTLAAVRGTDAFGP